jgi:ammonia channel protein AmtB
MATEFDSSTKKSLLVRLPTGCFAFRAADMPGVVAAHGNLDKNLQSFVTDRPQPPLVWEQLKAIGLMPALAIAGTTVIAYIVKALIGLRPTVEVETIGLDLAELEEEGYHA